MLILSFFVIIELNKKSNYQSLLIDGGKFMVYFKNQAKCIKEILNCLPNNSIKQIYLIGSYAKGTPSEFSDLDIVIVSDLFHNLSRYLRKRIFNAALNTTSIPIDFICLTNSENIKYQKSNAFQKENKKLLYGGKFYD